MCYGWASNYSLNRTWNYELASIHPRVKEPVGRRLARAALALMSGPTPTPQPTPKLAGCRLTAAAGASNTDDAGGVRLILHFDSTLLGSEGVALHFPSAGADPLSVGLIPLELQVGPYIPTGPGNSSGWVHAASLSVVNATAIEVSLPAGVTAIPTAVRYAWGDYPCCPGIDKATAFCPPSACPIFSARTMEPAVPFWAHIKADKCRCEAPWTCDA